MRDFFEFNKNDLISELVPLSRNEKQAQLRAKQIFNWVYQRFVTDFDQMSDLSLQLRQALKARFQFSMIHTELEQKSIDTTTKYLWKLADQKTIESVLIPSNNLDRFTLCISSQVGCAMACGFCLTGTQGFSRNLSAHEIVSQVWQVRKDNTFHNIVFMGMGEPLHNMENVIKACEILLDQDGLGFSKRKITVSTSGLVPKIEEFGKRIDVSLAISLNGTQNAIRSELMPVNDKWNIETLLDACRKYPLGKHRYITFEYILIKDKTDQLEQAKELKRLVRGIPSKINLIPFNEHAGSSYKRPSDEVIKAFQHELVKSGVTAPVRKSKGRDILAACGQLKSAHSPSRLRIQSPSGS